MIVKFVSFFILIFLSVFNCISQEISFSGYLKDEESNQPVPYALLYIDGSTLGVTTDEEGFFLFNNLILPVQIEISHLSYQPKSILIDKNNINQKVITLNQKEVKLREVLILDNNLRTEYVNKFKHWFIGKDKWGASSKLLNDDALVFFGEGDEFRVEATEPLFIESKRLGYTIRAELKDFLVKYNCDIGSEIGFYLASYHFTPVMKKRYDKNRDRAYYNSSEHFLKSVYDKNTSSNGFKILEAFKNDITNKLDYHIVSLDSNLVQNGINEKRIVGLEKKEYFILFYYKNNGYPLNLEENTPKQQYELSSIKFEDDEILIRSDGTTPSTSLVFTGAIGQKQVGAMLPINFQPMKNQVLNPLDIIGTQLPERLIRKRSN